VAPASRRARWHEASRRRVDLVAPWVATPVRQFRPTLLSGDDRAEELPRQRTVDCAHLTTPVGRLDVQVLAKGGGVGMSGAKRRVVPDLHARRNSSEIQRGMPGEDQSVRVQAVRVVAGDCRPYAWRYTSMLADHGRSRQLLEARSNLSGECLQLAQDGGLEVEHACHVLAGGDQRKAEPNRA
jgi:hypothetical protein